MRSDAADRQIAELAAVQCGVLSLVELNACGLSDSAVRKRVASGRLHRVHRGVFAVGHPTLPLPGVFIAAVKACGDHAVLSHVAAAAHWGMLSWGNRIPEVTIIGSTPNPRPGILVHATGSLDPRDRRVAEGIPVTSPARTLVDLASTFGDRALRRTARQAQSLGLVTPTQVLEAMGRAGRRRGVGTLAKVLATGLAPTRSELEDVVLELILSADLEHPDVNAPLILDGRKVIPDFRWPAQKLVIEADSVQWHDSKLAREDDADRQALLEAHGERVLRVTWKQAVGDSWGTLRRIRAAGAPPAQSKP